MAPKKPHVVRREADKADAVSAADIAAYEAGLSLTDLSKRLNRSLVWTRKQLSSAGVAVRGFNVHGGSDELTADDIALYQNGGSLDDLAARTHRSPGWCRRHLSEAGVRIRAATEHRPAETRQFERGYVHEGRK